MCLSSNDEAGLDTRPALVAVERRYLPVDPVPIELGCELNQLVLHIDDLIEPGPEQIAFFSQLRLLWSHRPLRRGIESGSAIRGNLKLKLQASEPQPCQSLQAKTHHCPENRLLISSLSVLHGRLWSLARTWRVHGRARTTRLHRPARCCTSDSIAPSTAFRSTFVTTRTPLLPARNGRSRARIHEIRNGNIFARRS